MRRGWSFLIAATLLAAPAEAIVIRHDVDDRAYRGDAADYPFLFALYRTRTGVPDCVATLVAPQWAVTAAHCTEDEALVQALQRGTGHPVEIGGRTFSVDRVERAPSPEGGRRVDLALVHLSRPVEHVRPISIYRAGDEVGRVVLLPGWGDRGNGQIGVQESDGALRIAENRVDAARDGLLVWEFDNPASAVGRALALEGISGPGDSGGPALIMTPGGWQTAGVSSGQRTFGRPEGLYGAEEFYVRLSEFAAWIDRIVTGG